MILFMKGEWNANISLEFTGNCRNPQESTGIYRNLQEIEGNVIFQILRHLKTSVRLRLLYGRFKLQRKGPWLDF